MNTAKPTPRNGGQERGCPAESLLSPFSRLVAGLAVIVVISGCGLRTPVRPVEDTAPVIPGVVKVTREDGVVAVRWNRADRSADGERLDDLAAFVVERKREGSDAWERVGNVDVIDQEKIRRRRDFTWRDTEAGAGPVSYRVRAVCADGQEGPATAPMPAVDATR